MVQIFIASALSDFCRYIFFNVLPPYWALLLIIVIGVIIFMVYRNVIVISFSLAISWAVLMLINILTI